MAESSRIIFRIYVMCLFFFCAICAFIFWVILCMLFPHLSNFINSIEKAECEQYIINPEPINQANITDIGSPPIIVIDATSDDMMVLEGGSAKFICTALGYPKPTIVWSRLDGHDIKVRGKTFSSYQGNILPLTTVSRSDTGTYICTASNGFPPAAHISIKLQVIFKPHIQVPKRKIEVAIGSNAQLICNVDALPNTVNYWERENGDIVSDHSRKTDSQSNPSLMQTQMVLKLSKLDKEDFGEYRCISKTISGEAEGSIQISELSNNANSIRKLDLLPINFLIVVCLSTAL